MRFLLLTNAIILCILTIQIPALWADPSIAVSTSDSSLSTEDSTTLTVEIEWPSSEGNYTFAMPDLLLENLSVVRRGESQQGFLREGQGWSRKTFEVELQPAQPGKAIIGAFNLVYINEDQLSGSFELSEQSLSVKRPSKSTDYFLIGSLGGGLILLLAGIVFFLSRRRKVTRKDIDDIIKLSAEDEAIARVRLLGESLGYKNPQDSLAGLGRELKSYVHTNYQLGTMSMSESEFVNEIKHKNENKEEIKRLELLFHRLHEYKYSGAVPRDSEIKELISEVVQYFEGKKVNKL